MLTNLDSILKSRDITLPTKVHLLKAMVLPVVMYGCESWTIKKAECWRIDAVELWCWRRLWIFIGRTDVEAGTPILWPPDAKNWLIRKDPDAGKDWRQEEKGMTENERLMASPTLWTWIWASSRSQWRTQKPGVLQSTGSLRVGHDWATELTDSPRCR